MKTIAVNIRSLSIISIAFLVLGIGLSTQAMARPGTEEETLDIQSAGALGFSPDGILFVGDWIGGAVYAFDVGEEEVSEAVDTAPADDAVVGTTPIDNIDIAVANVLGVNAAEVTINDMMVHPQTQEVFLSVTRGHGFSGMPAIVKVDQQGNIENLRLDELSFSKQSLNDVPDMDTQFQPRGMMVPPTKKDLIKAEASIRTLAIMDIDYYDGELFVAGVSNEEFSSTLRRIPFPFTGEYSASKIGIYHKNHLNFETRAPIRAQVVTEIQGEDYLVASYTCSPLVLFPLADLKDGATVSGKTVAEMGTGQPVDMFTFSSEDGKPFIMVTNAAFSTLKISLDEVVAAEEITWENSQLGDRQGVSGTDFPTVGTVLHMDKFDDNNYAAIVRDPYTGALNLENHGGFGGGFQLHYLMAEFDFPGVEWPPMTLMSRMQELRERSQQ